MLKKPVPISYADGAFSIVHYKVLEDIGWFDPRFFLYYEDVEFSLRAWTKGYPSILIPVILGKHYRSITAKKASLRSFYLHVRNRVFTTVYYMGFHSFYRFLQWYILYPIRLLEIKNNKELQFLFDKIQPSIKDVMSTKIALLKNFTLATIEALRVARREIARRHYVSIVNTPIIHVGLTDLFSQKRVFSVVQNQVRKYLSKALI